MPDIKRKSVDLIKKDGKIIISTINPDRIGDCVNPKGCHLENYIKNPVIMWLHDYSGKTASAGIPIARCPGLTITEDSIVSEEPQFLENDTFAQRVKNAWEQGFIKTASIGFAPIKEPVMNDHGGMDFEEWELLEWSLVPIPMNAEAMRVAKTKGFEDLVEKKKPITQAEIQDQIDYLKTMIDEVGVSDETRKSARELIKRLSECDNSVDIETIGKLFDQAKKKLTGGK